MNTNVAPGRALPTDSAARKQVPMASGLLDYFPDALAEIAHVSFLGNQKHNPGEPLHWARGKAMDHADCIVRHLTERGALDPAGVRHSAQLAWRALALLQQELEDELGLPLPRGAKDDGPAVKDETDVGSAIGFPAWKRAEVGDSVMWRDSKGLKRINSVAAVDDRSPEVRVVVATEAGHTVLHNSRVIKIVS